MAYRIAGTTNEDTDLLNLIRDLAWQERASVTKTIRDAFTLLLAQQNEAGPR